MLPKKCSNALITKGRRVTCGGRIGGGRFICPVCQETPIAQNTEVSIDVLNKWRSRSRHLSRVLVDNQKLRARVTCLESKAALSYEQGLQDSLK